VSFEGGAGRPSLARTTSRSVHLGAMLSAQFAPCTSGSLDDEESIRGSDNDVAIDMGGHHKKTVGHPTVCLGHRRQRCPATRPAALAAKLGHGNDPPAAADAPYLAQTRLATTRAIHVSPSQSCNYRCSSHSPLLLITIVTADALNESAAHGPNPLRLWEVSRRSPWPEPPTTALERRQFLAAQGKSLSACYARSPSRSPRGLQNLLMGTPRGGGIRRSGARAQPSRVDAGGEDIRAHERGRSGRDRAARPALGVRRRPRTAMRSFGKNPEGSDGT
jgi:hypothetical protein